MDPEKFPLIGDRKGLVVVGNEKYIMFNPSDCSADESYDYESSVDEDCYNEEDFSSFQDVTRSKKFYLKKKELDVAKMQELEDVFEERLNEEGKDREEEKILQVVWSDEDPVQSKLVRFIEALDIKKSNSKFTLSMLDENRGGIEVDSSEGEEVRGRFLEVKDSLEVIATSSRSLQGSKYSDWDFSTEEDQEVNKIWRKRDSPWTSSLQIEIGKLPSEADQETVLQILDDGAQGRISVRDVTECLGNLLHSVNEDNDSSPSKKVCFSDVASNKSFLSKENLSQSSSSQSQRSASLKKVSFPSKNSKGILNGATDKPTKKVSFYDLVDNEGECVPQPEIAKIKKAVSFHDSVDFDKAEKIKESLKHARSFTEDVNQIIDSLNSSSKSSEYQVSEEYQKTYYRDDQSNTSGGNSVLGYKVISGASLMESFYNFSIPATSNDDSMLAISECHDFSDLSAHSSNQGEGRNAPLTLLPYLSDTTDPPSDCDSNRTGAISENTKDETYLESRLERIEFIRRLIEDSLNKKFEEKWECESTSSKNESKEMYEPLTGRLNKTLKLMYDQCREMVDIDILSIPIADQCGIGLAMTFQDLPSDYINFKLKNETPPKAESFSNLKNKVDDEDQCLENQTTRKAEEDPPAKSRKKNKHLGKHRRTGEIEDSYLSADSEGETQVNFAYISDPVVPYLLNKYIFQDNPSNVESSVSSSYESKQN